MPRPHKTFPVELPEYDHLCDIDEDLIQLIETMNRFGFHTVASCQEFKPGAAMVEVREDIFQWRGRRMFNRLIEAIEDAMGILAEAHSPGRDCMFLLQKELLRGVVDDRSGVIIDCEASRRVRKGDLDRARRDAIEALEAALRKRTE